MDKGTYLRKAFRPRDFVSRRAKLNEECPFSTRQSPGSSSSDPDCSADRDRAHQIVFRYSSSAAFCSSVKFVPNLSPVCPTLLFPGSEVSKVQPIPVVE